MAEHTISIPLAEIPPTANKRLHWAARAKRVAHPRAMANIYARQAWMEAGRPAKPTAARPVRVEVIWLRKRGPLPDPDALPAMTKPIFDGITDSGVWWIDDNHRGISSVTWSQVRLPSGDVTGPRMRVNVTVGVEDIQEREQRSA